ncbi:MAG: hypothetical protein U1E65_07500 [Myxococcota bacterium]
MRASHVFLFLSAFAPISAAAQEAKATPETTAKAPAPPKVGTEPELSVSSMGAYDSNVTDKDKAISAGGFDVDLHAKLGVPLGERVGWGSSGAFGTKYRNGGATDTTQNTLRLEAGLNTGLEILFTGDASIPGRKVKSPLFPMVKLGLEGRYKLTATPMLQKPVQGFDDTADSLEADSDDEGDDDEGSSTGGGGQTFTNPNTHHKLSGVLKLGIEPAKRVGFNLEGGVHHDFVALGEGVLVSPEFTEIGGGATAKFKIVPEILHLSVGYGLEHRAYDEELAKNNEPLSFLVHGIKATLEFPFKFLKLKASYDLKLRVVDVDPSMNRTRHEVQAGAEIPVTEHWAALIDTRFSTTVAEGSGDAVRFIAMAGLKAKL